MKIVVNDMAASSGGALSVLKSFYSYIKKNDTKNEWIFLLSDRYVEETKNIKVIVLKEKNWFNRVKFDFFYGKKIIKKMNPDVYFSLQNTVVYGLNIPQVVYMHQSIPFQDVKKFSFFKSDERYLAIYQYIIGKIIKNSVKKATKVIVQTEWIKEAIIRTAKVSSKNIVKVFPNELNLTNFKKESMFRQDSFFYPASDYVYKNHECIYNACDILNKKGFNDFNIKLTISEPNIRNNISYLGEQSFENVMHLYNTSTLVFPSYIETVGLPLLEARQMGAIILASDCPFSREVLADYSNAYYFNPFKPQELANLMERVISGDIVKKEALYNEPINNNSWEEVKKILLDTI